MYIPTNDLLTQCYTVNRWHCIC